jgi:transposase, IS30 family
MKHLTSEQRYTISVMLQNGHSQREIAEIIGKDKSTISREIRRNRDKRNGVYKSKLAQKNYNKRQKEKPKKKHFTEEIKIYVEGKLSEDYSPEQIYGRAKIEGIKCVSHERIYQHIWADKHQGGELYIHLRRRNKRYRKRGNLRDNRGMIKDRISIDKRPKIVEEKKRFGDFEIDTIIGKNKKGAILTINDRWSSKVWIKKLEGKFAKPLSEKAVEVLYSIKELIHTITGDNGKEFADHKTISKQLEIDFYFAHAYHSWERGANENTNGLIRQYIPKKTDFSTITDEYIEYVQNKLNHRPRKRLNFLSPNEIYNKFVKSNTNKKVALVT